MVQPLAMVGKLQKIKTIQQTHGSEIKPLLIFTIFHGMFTFNVPAADWYEMIDDVEQLAFVFCCIY